MERPAHALHLIKNNWLAFNMIIGLMGYKLLCPIKFLLPYLIFGMLFFTFININLQRLKFKKWHALILIGQCLAGGGLFVSIRCLLAISPAAPYSDVVAQGIAICVLMPTASAAPIVCRKLNGDIYTATAFMFLSNIVSALVLPLFFSTVNPQNNQTFLSMTLTILQRTCSVLLLPLVLTTLIQTSFRLLKKKYKGYIRPTARLLASTVNLPFYLWAGTITILTADMTKTLIEGRYDMIMIALLVFLSLPVCLLQFSLGAATSGEDNRKFGFRHMRYLFHSHPTMKKSPVAIAAGQVCGQKNTTFGIWLSQMYLLPFAFLAPAAYMIWQNILNNNKISRCR